jgi:hypothetical protein
MNISDKFSISSNVLSNEVGDETVILDLASGTYFGLDPVGARLWRLIQDGKTVAEVCDVLVEEFDVSRSRVEQDALALAQDLVDKKLIRAS